MVLQGIQLTRPDADDWTKLLGSCSRPRGYYWAQYGDHTYYVPVACGKWSCRACGDRMRKRLLKVVKQAARSLTRQHRGWRCREVGLTFAQRGMTRSQAWNKLRVRRPDFLRRLRKLAPPVEYFWVVDAHTSGYPHLHLVVWGPEDLSSAALTKLWRKSGSGRAVTDVARKRDALLGYVCGRLPGSLAHLPKRARRYGYSRGFGRAVREARGGAPEGESPWTFQAGSLYARLRGDEAKGLQVRRAPSRQIASGPPIPDLVGTVLPTPPGMSQAGEPLNDAFYDP